MTSITLQTFRTLASVLTAFVLVLAPFSAAHAQDATGTSADSISIDNTVVNDGLGMDSDLPDEQPALNKADSTGDSVNSNNSTENEFEITETQTVNSEEELNAAIDNLTITEITLGSDFGISSTVDVHRSVSIDGDGFTLTAEAGVTDTGLLITGDDVTVSDLTVNASNRSIQAIQAYVASNVSLVNVVAMNAGKSGIHVNGSTVTVTNVKTSGNSYHGINVDQGLNVTSPAVLTVSGVSSHLESGHTPAIFVDSRDRGSVTGNLDQYTMITQPPVPPNAEAYFLSTVNSEQELNIALDRPFIPTITLGSSFEVDAPVVLDRSVTIDGNEQALTGTFNRSANTNTSVVLISENDVAIGSLTVDGNDNNVNGIQAYAVTGVTLNNVTLQDAKAGMIVNGSTVTATNLSTSGNEWGGVNVDRGTGVATPAVFTVQGISSHSETTPHIWIDSNAKRDAGTVSVNDVESQYTATNQLINGIEGTVYFLNEEEEDDNDGGSRSSSSRRSGGGGGGSDNDDDEDDAGQVLGAATTTVSTVGQVLGASTYNFMVDLTIGSTGADVTELQSRLIAGGYLMITAPTGYFGELTRAALAKWQAANGIAPAAGYFGPLSRGRMNGGSSPMSVQAQIEAIQAQLAALVAQRNAANASSTGSN